MGKVVGESGGVPVEMSELIGSVDRILGYDSCRYYMERLLRVRVKSAPRLTIVFSLRISRVKHPMSKTWIIVSRKVRYCCILNTDPQLAYKMLSPQLRLFLFPEPESCRTLNIVSQEVFTEIARILLVQSVQQ